MSYEALVKFGSSSPVVADDDPNSGVSKAAAVQQQVVELAREFERRRVALTGNNLLTERGKQDALAKLGANTTEEVQKVASSPGGLKQLVQIRAEASKAYEVAIRGFGVAPEKADVARTLLHQELRAVLRSKSDKPYERGQFVLDAVKSGDFELVDAVLSAPPALRDDLIDVNSRDLATAVLAETRAPGSGAALLQADFNVESLADSVQEVVRGVRVNANVRVDASTDKLNDLPERDPFTAELVKNARQFQNFRVGSAQG